MRRIDKSRYDFRTDAWIRDDFLTPEKKERFGELPEPATPPTPGRWTAPPAQSVKPPLFLIALVSLPFGALLLLGIVLQFHALFAVGMVWLLLSAIVFQQLVHRPADRSLVEDPDDLEVCLVKLVVWRNGAGVGTDRGVAWFEEGRLLYNGHRTSFALGGEDVLPRSRWGVFDGADGVSLLPTFGVPLRLHQDRAFVLLTPISSNDAVAHKREIGFLKRLYEFRLRPTESCGSHQWPPLEPWRSS